MQIDDLSFVLKIVSFPVTSRKLTRARLNVNKIFLFSQFTFDDATSVMTGPGNAAGRRLESVNSKISVD